MTLLGAPLSTLIPAGAAAAAALVALYLLRPSRRRLEVPYARLWGLIAKEARSSATARRLRRWESLLLQLVIAALILIALADPHVGTQHHPRHVILVDTSASMQARDASGGPTRMERAQREVGRIIDALDPDEEAILIGFDARPRPLTSLTSDEGQLRTAATRLRASDSGTELAPALQLAADVLRDAASARLTLVGDGAYESDFDPGAIDLRYVSVGTSADNLPPRGPRFGAGFAGSRNLAITGFSVRRYASNPSAYELLVEVRSNSDQPRHARLEILQEGESVDVSELDLPPNGRIQKRLTDLSGGGRKLEAKLTPKGYDALALDDHAYALLPDRRRARVLLVGDGSLYTNGALLLDRAVELEQQKSSDYDPQKLAGYDVVIFEGYAPPVPPDRPALYLGCGTGCPFSTHGSVDAPLVTESDREHPVMRYIALKDLNVSRSAVFALARGDVSLASTLGRSIFIAGARGGHRMLALGFAPSLSDLPLRVAFPVLLVNALQWLQGQAFEPTESVRTGHAASLAATGTMVSAVAPRGERVSLPVRGDHIELITDQVGYYTLDGDRLVASNLVDPIESQLSSRPFVLKGKAVPAPTLAGRLRPRASLWRWLVALALALVLFEWWTYHRRYTV